MANMQSMNRTEALRLADALSQGRYLTTDAGNPIAEAAAELRRLHAELAQLREKRQPTQLYRLLRSGELMREGDECLDDGTMTWHPVRNGWHSFPWSVINNPVRRVIEAAHNITGEPA